MRSFRRRLVSGLCMLVLLTPGPELLEATSGDPWKTLPEIEAGTEMRVTLLAGNGGAATARRIEGDLVAVEETSLVVEADRELFGRRETDPDGSMTVTLAPGIRLQARDKPEDDGKIRVVIPEESVLSVEARTGDSRVARGAIIGGLIGAGVGCLFLKGQCIFTAPLGAIGGAAWGSRHRTWERVHVGNGL